MQRSRRQSLAGEALNLSSHVDLRYSILNNAVLILSNAHRTTIERQTNFTMIIHCSQKFAAKLKDVSPTALHENSPLGSWHGHLLVLDRRQCVMFCHDATRFVLFLSGLRKEEFAELGSKWFRYFFVSVLAMSGCPEAQIKKAELALGPVRFDTVTDRSVQGSLRVAKQDLEAWVYQVPNVLGLDPLVMSCRLNERPATVRGQCLWPGRAMLEAVAAL